VGTSEQRLGSAIADLLDSTARDTQGRDLSLTRVLTRRSAAEALVFTTAFSQATDEWIDAEQLSTDLDRRFCRDALL